MKIIPLTIRLLLGFALCCLACQTLRAQEEASASSLPSWEYTPYKIQLFFSSSDQSFSAAELEATLSALKPLVEREWRGSWQTQWSVGTAPPAAAPAAAAAEPDADGAAPAAAPVAVDKIVDIDLQRFGAETRVQVTFRDTASRRVSEPLRLLAATTSEIPQQTAALLKAGFAPLARVTKYESKQATLRIKGGKLLGVSNQFVPGSVLLPLERARTDGTEPAEARSLKWTMLGVTRVSSGQLNTAVYSGLPQAGDPGENRPVDFLALGLQSVRAETELTILGMSPAVTAINPDIPADEQAKAAAMVTVPQAKVPLAGVRVTARPFNEPTRVAWQGTTDQLGRLRLPARWDAAAGTYRAQLWLLEIGAGGETLTTLPCCPGALEKLNLFLPANAQWVSTQQWLEETRELVLQVMARKKIQLARIAEANKNKQAAEVGRLQSELRLLPDAGKVMQSTPVLTLIPEGTEGTAALFALQKKQLEALTEIREFAKDQLGGVLPANPNLPVVPMAEEGMPPAEGEAPANQ